jgi:hypothetical protein
MLRVVIFLRVYCELMLRVVIFRVTKQGSRFYMRSEIGYNVLYDGVCQSLPYLMCIYHRNGPQFIVVTRHKLEHCFIENVLERIWKWRFIQPTNVRKFSGITLPTVVQGYGNKWHNGEGTEGLFMRSHLHGLIKTPPHLEALSSNTFCQGKRRHSWPWL